MSILLIIIAAILLFVFLSEAWPIILISIILGCFLFYYLQKHKKEKFLEQTTGDERLEISPNNTEEGKIYPENWIYEIWPEEDMLTSETRRRFERAKTQELVIDTLNMHGIANIRGTSGNIYETSLKSCTCTDFVRQQKPCKHILKLALYTGAISPDDDLLHIPDELEQRIKSLTKKAQKTLIEFCEQENGETIIPRSSDIDKLFAAGFLVETVNPAYLINQKYTMDDLRSILHGSERFSDLCSKCPRKADLIQRIIDAGDDCISLFTARYIIVQLDPEIAPYSGSIIEKFAE